MGATVVVVLVLVVVDELVVVVVDVDVDVDVDVVPPPLGGVHPTASTTPVPRTSRSTRVTTTLSTSHARTRKGS
jgi:hypothetical protein